MMERGSVSLDTPAALRLLLQLWPKVDTSHRCTHAAATRTGLRAGHRLQLTPGWQHDPTRALSGLLHGSWWVQS